VTQHVPFAELPEDVRRRLSSADEQAHLYAYCPRCHCSNEGGEPLHYDDCPLRPREPQKS